MNDTSPPAPGSVPVPDPTKLTTDAVNAATSQWRRDLASLREILETRLNAMDEATRLRLASLDDIVGQIEALKELHSEKFRAVDERAVAQQIAAGEALKAALQAAKELVGQQNDANATAAAVSAASFTKLIDQMGLRIEALQKGFDDRLSEIKERIDRGEGHSGGLAAGWGYLVAAVGLIATVIAIAIALH